MINLKTILDIASHQIAAAGVDCLLIGGFAVNYHGSIKTYELIRAQVEALKAP